MSSIRNLLTAGVLAVALCAPAGAQAPAVASLLKSLELTGYSPGTMPPGFSSHTPDAREISLAGLRGKVVIVNFWASWCAACRLEMPVLDRLHREFGPRGLVVVGINSGEDAQVVRRYAVRLSLTFPLALDPAGTVFQSHGVIGIPTTFLVARDGRAVALAVGPRDWESAPARALFGALLAEPVPHRRGT